MPTANFLFIPPDRVLLFFHEKKIGDELDEIRDEFDESSDDLAGIVESHHQSSSIISNLPLGI